VNCLAGAPGSDYLSRAIVDRRGAPTADTAFMGLTSCRWITTAAKLARRRRGAQIGIMPVAVSLSNAPPTATPSSVMGPGRQPALGHGAADLHRYQPGRQGDPGGQHALGDRDHAGREDSLRRQQWLGHGDAGLHRHRAARPGDQRRQPSCRHSAHAVSSQKARPAPHPWDHDHNRASRQAGHDAAAGRRWRWVGLGVSRSTASRRMTGTSGRTLAQPPSWTNWRLAEIFPVAGRWPRPRPRGRRPRQRCARPAGAACRNRAAP
jgi:hypothetical protein